MDEKPRRSRIRFGLRTLFEVIAVAAFVLTLIYYRTTAIQATGRFQFHMNTKREFLIDSQTGRVWTRENFPGTGIQWLEENVQIK